jgi:hypothetical protein
MIKRRRSIKRTGTVRDLGPHPALVPDGSMPSSFVISAPSSFEVSLSHILPQKKT